MQAAQSLHLPVYTANSKRPKIAIAFAFGLAILLHIIFILIPRTNQLDLPGQPSARIEIQMDRYEPLPVPPVPVPIEQPESPPEPVQSLIQEPPVQAKKEVPSLERTPEVRNTTVPQPTPVQPLNQNPEISPQKLQELSSSILSSQFIREQSPTEKIFGPPLISDPQPEQKAFHFPLRPNMITMLDKPVPDLPFAYTPGLVEFAYEPGVKGDMQRFWDKITPEFGWRTNYGTKVKCVWVLVVAACGWGRSDD